MTAGNADESPPLVPEQAEPQSNGHDYSPELPSPLRTVMHRLREDWQNDRFRAIADATYRFHREGGEAYLDGIALWADARGMSDRFITEAMAHGTKQWAEHKEEPAPPPKSNGKSQSNSYNQKPGAADVALNPDASKAVLRLDEWLKSDLGLPKLVIDSSNPTLAAKELAHLIAARDNFLFNGYAPVYVAAEAENMPKAILVKTETVRVLAHGICAPVKAGKNGEFIPIAISEDIAGLYLRGLEGFWGLKPLNGITTAPILSGDGSIRVAKGYDPVSGMWCHNIPAVQVPEHPTMEEANAALAYIRQRFRTFPFADGKRARDPQLDLDVIDVTSPADLDESSFLTMLLTGVCRQSLDTAPGLLCDAPSYSGAGTGKGLLVKSICVIASGARPAAFTSGHDEAELDKRLTSALVEARPAVFLDNFNAKELTSDTLASALTENPAMVRVMGQTKNVPLNVRTFIGITGNGVDIAEDMARRIIKVRLDAQMESPEERKFKPGFLDDIVAERLKLLSAVLTIWRWGRQNRLKEGRALGGFETWCQWCRDPLLALGMKDPVDRVAEIKANDPRRRALMEIFETWWDKHGGAELKATELNAAVLELIDTRASRRPDDSLNYSRQKVARFLSRTAATRVGGYSLDQRKDGPPAKQVAYYKLTYTIQQSEPLP
jgi:putative DNA primase/helicase